MTGISFQLISFNKYYMLSSNFYCLTWSYVAFIMCVVDQLRHLDLNINYHVFIINLSHKKYSLQLIPDNDWYFFPICLSQ